MALLVNPTFIRQPVNQTVAPGEWVTLSAAVNEFATRPITFGWRSNNVFVVIDATPFEQRFYRLVTPRQP